MPRIYPTVQERFDKYTKKDLSNPSACWEWIGGHFKTGYGSLGIKNVGKLAHRVSYELYVGPIPKKMTIDHLCYNRNCVNPAHFEVVTRGENRSRGPLAGIALKWAKRTHCKNGHILAGDNLRKLTTKPGRMCLKCHNERELNRWYTKQGRTRIKKEDKSG